MSFWHETNWFAVQAKSHCENLAAASVAKLDVEICFPRIKQEHSVCGLLRLGTKALFPGYFFARFCPLLSLDAVRYAHGVSRVVSASRIPLPLGAEIISEIQARIEDDGYVKLKPRLFAPGDQIAIEEGPLQGLIGRVEREWDDGKRVLILLEAIQQARVLIEKRLLAVK